MHTNIHTYARTLGVSHIILEFPMFSVDIIKFNFYLARTSLSSLYRTKINAKTYRMKKQNQKNLKNPQIDSSTFDQAYAHTFGKSISKQFRIFFQKPVLIAQAIDFFISIRNSSIYFDPYTTHNCTRM